MPIMALIIAMIAFIALWLWRGRTMRGPAAGAGPAASAKGGASRVRRPATSVLANVHDPGVAAAILLYSLTALKRAVGSADEDRIDAKLEQVCRMPPRDRQEAMAFAAWASAHVADTNDIIRRFTPMWSTRLDAKEKRELVDMALEIAEAGGSPNEAQAAAIKRLSEGLLASSS